MLVVGAAKCGTTSLAAFLRLHPDIFMPGIKELSFFLPPEGQRIETLDSYKASFAAAEDQSIRGEASVNYLYYEESPRLIHETLSADVKLVVMLRNPLEMAYSLWGHNRRLEREPRDFQDALDHEHARMTGSDDLVGWRPNYFYRARATYAPQIQRYLDQFASENIRIMLFEDVIREPASELGNLCDWLGVSREVPLEFPRLNPAGSNRIRSLRKWIDGDSGLKKLLKQSIPDGIRLPLRRVTERFNRTKRAQERLDGETRERLMGLFTQDISMLSDLIGRDLEGLWIQTSTNGMSS